MFALFAPNTLRRYTGPLTVHVQEPDTFGRHVVQVEGKEEVQSIEMPLQTKPYKRLKRKKTRIQNGDEVKQFVVLFFCISYTPRRSTWIHRALSMRLEMKVNCCGLHSTMRWRLSDVSIYTLMSIVGSWR